MWANGKHQSILPSIKQAIESHQPSATSGAKEFTPKTPQKDQVAASGARTPKKHSIVDEPAGVIFLTIDSQVKIARSESAMRWHFEQPRVDLCEDLKSQMQYAHIFGNDPTIICR